MEQLLFYREIYPEVLSVEELAKPPLFVRSSYDLSPNHAYDCTQDIFSHWR